MNCENLKDPSKQEQNPLNLSNEELEEQKVKDWLELCKCFCG